ncbi:MAG: rRNA pseudouridine synthase [Clostridiales bacterium]|jgi:23S rRNA pseudouridine2605 synthase|nr:rRNA pseudouridine synthase [Clostridiales bacterium]
MNENITPENSNQEQKPIRLQKYIANCGVCSRRKAEEYIADGSVMVNGEVITQLGTKVTNSDIIEITLDGETKIIKPDNTKLYLLLNKPVGVVTTANDEHDRPTVIDLITQEITTRVYPVGRLDIATSGAILLTNDGDFANKITHPSNKLPKKYSVIINGDIQDSQVNKLTNGLEITLEDGSKYTTQPAIVDLKRQYPTQTYLDITITEGKNRQVRRMFEALGYKVLKLERVEIGCVKLGNLPSGRFRYLTSVEIEIMKVCPKKASR